MSCELLSQAQARAPSPCPTLGWPEEKGPDRSWGHQGLEGSRGPSVGAAGSSGLSVSLGAPAFPPA